MDQERYRTFLNSLYQPLDGPLADIEKEAIETYVPIIRKDAQQYLATIVRAIKPERILEIGTAVGFSGSLMLLNAPEAKLTTIENWEPRFEIAENNFKRTGVWDRVEFLKGDSAEIVPELVGKGTYDLIFMDAAKGQYPALLPDIIELMHEGSLLLTDNVLFDGEILESRFVVERRDRTIHKRMREYLYMLTHDERLMTSVLSVGDGMSVSVRI